MQRHIAQLFTLDSSQAASLPHAFHFESVSQVYIRRRDSTEDIIVPSRPPMSRSAFVGLHER